MSKTYFFASTVFCCGRFSPFLISRFLASALCADASKQRITYFFVRFPDPHPAVPSCHPGLFFSLLKASAQSKKLLCFPKHFPTFIFPMCILMHMGKTVRSKPQVSIRDGIQSLDGYDLRWFKLCSQNDRVLCLRRDVSFFSAIEYLQLYFINGVKWMLMGAHEWHECHECCQVNAHKWHRSPKF